MIELNVLPNDLNLEELNFKPAQIDPLHVKQVFPYVYTDYKKIKARNPDRLDLWNVAPLFEEIILVGSIVWLHEVISLDPLYASEKADDITAQVQQARRL